jgi:DNA-binding transcriptional LysR family regulator
MMDLWQLNIFCKVIELKSFSRAGAAVYLSQPTVSSHIKDLEESAGCRLIDRLPKEALPTRAGELLYGYAKKLLSLRDEAETALAAFQGTIKGQLSIGGSSIPGVYILPRIIGMYIKKFPEVKISLTIGDTGSTIEHILSGELEMGVVGAFSEDVGLDQEEMFEDDMRLIVPADHKWAGKEDISLDELKKEPFIVRERGSGTRISIQQSFREKGRSIRNLNIASEMGSTEAVLQAIKAGAGVSIMSMLAVSEDVETGCLKALSIRGVDLAQRFYITRLKGRTPSPLCESFFEFMKAEPVDI